MKWRELLSVSILEALLIALIVGVTFVFIAWPFLRPQATVLPRSFEMQSEENSHEKEVP